MLHNLFYFPQHAVYFKISSFSVQTILTFFIKHAPQFHPLNAELNPICLLLALLGAHPILHISKIRVNVARF